MKKPVSKKGKYPVHVKFGGKILIVGFGSIGQGILPLILRHIGIEKKNIKIITAAPLGREIARKEGVTFEINPLKKNNYKKILDNELKAGDFLLNLSVEVSSLDLIRYCHERDILYLDTVVEPWLGGYSDPKLTVSQRSNYGLRELLLELKRTSGVGPTAVSCHGANPGIVSHFVKQALLNIAKKIGQPVDAPKTREGWAALMKNLGVKTVHIAEYDSQVAKEPKKIGRFENTWSVNGFHSEGICQPSEMGWGTHEKQLPKGGSRHTYGCGAAIYLDRPGARVLVRTWTPLHGPFLGRVVTHNESVSMADYFSVKNGKKVSFRPTVHYAYRSCDVSILSIEECFGKGSVIQKEERILMDEITTGMDELGVLLMGDKHGAYWYGSQLTIEETRKIAPYQNATGLQVTAGALGAMIWAMENPRAGIVEADEIDFKRIMDIITPYMGKMTGAFTDWTPLKSADRSFDADIDERDPWQFKNFLFS